MTYAVTFSRTAKKEFDKLPMSVQGRLLPKVEALAHDPRPPGSKKLKNLEESYRIRDGDFRVLYTVHDDIVVVYVFRVEPRKDAYRGL